MSNKTVKVKKKKLNIKKFLIFCLFLYLAVYGIYFLLSAPIRHIKITGNTFVSDAEIIEAAKLKNYPSFFKYLSFSIEKKIEKLSLVNDAKVQKKWGFVLEIKITENKPLFLNSEDNLIYLSNKETIKNTNNIMGIPTLTNSVDKKVLNKFIEKLSQVDFNIIYEINEISYDISYNEKGEVLDAERFKVIMNDGNYVYLTAEKANKLNYYNEIYASINDKKGTLFLDSGDYGNFGFTPFGSD